VNLTNQGELVPVGMTSGEQLPDPATAIAPPMPSVSPRIRLAESVKPGHHCLKACRWKRQLQIN
jgi:hypothetical protein